MQKRVEPHFGPTGERVMEPVPSGSTPAFQPAQHPPITESDTTTRNLTLAVHLLYLASWVTGVSMLIGLVIAYMKRGDAAGTIYESHLT